MNDIMNGIYRKIDNSFRNAKGFALYEEGVKYACGDGVDRDDTRAFNAFVKADNLKLAPAMCALGDCYRLGIGTGINSHKAMYQYLEAAHAGDAEGAYHYANYCANDQTYGDVTIKRDILFHDAYMKRAADGGYLPALREHAYRQLQEGVMSQCVKYYSLAADQGCAASADMCSALYMHLSKEGIMPQEGSDVSRDYAKGIQYLIMAANLGDIQAMHSVKDIAIAVEDHRYADEMADKIAAYVAANKPTTDKEAC